MRQDELPLWAAKVNGLSIRRNGSGQRSFHASSTELEKAQRILAALEEAATQGKGAAALDGHPLIDAASARMANNVVKMAEAIGATAT